MGDDLSPRESLDAPAHRTAPSEMKFAEAIAGGGSGFLTVILLHPLDTLKTVLQSSSGGGGTRSAAAAILSRGGGVSALYRGAGPAIVGSAGSWAIYLQAFYTLRDALPRFYGRDFAAGAAAGCMTAALTNPIWMLKTRMQLERSGRGVASFAANIARTEGIGAFYRGLVPSLWLVSNASIQFALYEHIKSVLGDGSGAHPTAANAAIASAVSKLVSSSTTYPLQVIRTRIQEPNAKVKGYNSFPTTARLIARREGLAVFYRGLPANLIRVVPQSSLTLVLYESLLKALQ